MLKIYFNVPSAFLNAQYEGTKSWTLLKLHQGKTAKSLVFLREISFCPTVSRMKPPSVVHDALNIKANITDVTNRFRPGEQKGPRIIKLQRMCQVSIKYVEPV